MIVSKKALSSKWRNIVSQMSSRILNKISVQARGTCHQWAKCKISIIRKAFYSFFCCCITLKLPENSTVWMGPSWPTNRATGTAGSDEEVTSLLPTFILLLLRWWSLGDYCILVAPRKAAGEQEKYNEWMDWIDGACSGEKRSWFGIEKNHDRPLFLPLRQWNFPVLLGPPDQRASGFLLSN